MKIGIDISQIAYQGTGVARFTNGLVNSILDFDRTNNWIFFFSSFRRNLDPNIEKKILEQRHKLIKWKLPPTALSILFNDLHNISKFLISNFQFLNNLDWFITSDWTEPPLNIKRATIVHDLVYLRYPETVEQKILKTQKKRLNWVKKESKIIFTDSHSTKDDLVDFLNIDSRKIIINYPGVETLTPTNHKIEETLKKYNLSRPFILSVAKLEPRKNIVRLIKAFNGINKKSLSLVIVGPAGWNNSVTINQLIVTGSNKIRYLGLVTDEDLYSLYSLSLFYIQPSIWEGFGYPIIEAMKLGVPVATSNTSSLKEIAKDSALFFNPFDVNDIYRCINIMIKDAKLRANLAKKGLERSKMFTWKNYYQNLISTLMSFPQNSRTAGRKRESIE